MLDEEICKLREELNNSIVNGTEFKKIYELSTNLDQLIEKYYIKKEKVKC